MEGVNRMAEGIRLPSMQKAVNYRDGQEEAYKKSVLQSSQAQTFALLGDPNVSQEEKDSALDAEERNLRMFAGQQPVMVKGRIEWQGGRDVGAEIMALRQKARAVNVEGFIAAKDVAGAQRALDMASGGGTASAPGSLSERNLAAYNFGNVKNTKGNFVAYATREDGLMGPGERMLRYADVRGAKTLLDAMKIYAPYGDGANDPEKYAAFLGKKLGIDPRAKADFRDPKILAGLIKWMPVMEHGAQRVNISDDEAMQAAQSLLAGQKPHIVGEAAKKGEGSVQAGGASALLPPAELARLQGKIDHARREQAQEAGLTAQAFGNHLEYGLEKGDFTAAEQDVAVLRSLGFAAEAAELSGRLELARTVHAALNDVSDLPLAEQAAAVHAQLDSMVTPDNAKAAMSMRDNVDRALVQKQAAFIKDPAASVAALPSMQGEMPPQERVRRSLELQERMGAGLAFEPRVLPVEQARQLKAAYDKLDAPASRVAWLSELTKTYGPYARQALHEMQVPEQVVTLLPVLGTMNEKSMGLALSALEVKDGDIPGLDKDAKQAAVDAAASNRLLKDVLALSRAFPANEEMRRFGQGMETMLTNYAKLGGNLADFDKAFESAASGECFLMLPRNAGYDVDDVVDATRDVREDLREKLLAGVAAHTQQGRLDHTNLSGLIERGVFVSDETGTRVTLIDPQHGRPVLHSDGTPMSFDIAAIVKSRTERNVRQRYKFAEDGLDALASLEVES